MGFGNNQQNSYHCFQQNAKNVYLVLTLYDVVCIIMQVSYVFRVVTVRQARLDYTVWSYPILRSSFMSGIISVSFFSFSGIIHDNKENI